MERRTVWGGNLRLRRRGGTFAGSLSAGYAEAIDGFSDEELQSPIQLFGHTANRGAMLVDLVVCGHAAYRTQLFCYLKSCGREELNTMNLWAGVDAA